MRRPLAGLALAFLASAPVHAQSLQEEFGGLFTFADCGEPLCLNLSNEHGNHYIPAVQAGQNNLLAFLNNAIAVSLGNSIPFTAASSGVTFRFEGGVPVATSVSAGPIFAERAQTLGQGRFLVGVNVTNFAFSSFRGADLEDLQFNFVHQNVGHEDLGNPTFENDVIEVRTQMDLSLLVTALSVSYGLGDRVDLSVSVPVVRTSLSGRSDALVRPFQSPTPHTFDEAGSLSAAATADGSAFGIGDVGGRLKVNLYQTESAGLAFVGDVRLPTGSEEDFHGSGETTIRGIGIYSGRFGDFSPHLNAGFALRSGDSQQNSALLAVGFDQLLSESVTLALDVLGDLVLGDAALTVPDPVEFDVPTRRTVALTNIPDETDSLLNGSVGFKFATPGDYRVVTNVQIPLTDGGIHSDFVWTLGLERTF